MVEGVTDEGQWAQNRSVLVPQEGFNSNNYCNKWLGNKIKEYKWSTRCHFWLKTPMVRTSCKHNLESKQDTQCHQANNGVLLKQRTINIH